MKKTACCVIACVICWAAVLAVCFGLLCAAAAVPDSSIAGALASSCDKLAVHEPHEKTVGTLYNSVCDNYADAVLLGVAANMSSEDIPRSVIDTRYYDDDYGPAVGIRATLNGKKGNIDYTRYWHGSLVFVRPLLALTDIGGIRMIAAAVTALLLLGNIALLIYKKHKAAAVLLVVSAVLVHFWFVFTALEYMTTFIIMLAVLPLYVRYAGSPRVLAVISAGVGTVTAFADFLTTETLTLLVPLAMSFFITAESGEKPDGRKSLITTVSCGAAWGCGYLFTFAAKWVTASAMLGGSISSAALSAAGERFTGATEGLSSVPELFFSSLGANLSMLAPVSQKISVAGILVWLALFAAVCTVIYRKDRRTHNLPKASIIVIAAVPLIRISVLMNHSYLHNFFTYRALMASIMAILGLMWYRVGGAGAGKGQRNKKTKTKP